MSVPAVAGSPAASSSDQQRSWRIAGIGITCIALVLYTYIACRAQPRPPTVYFDDAWPLIGWKVNTFLDFRRAAYTAFGFVFLERLWLELFSFSTVHARWFPLLLTLAIGPGFLLVALRMRIRYAAALLGAVLLVTSPDLATMSTHVKQYSLDVLLGIALIGLAAALIRDPTSSRRWVFFSSVAVGALVGSFAVIGIVFAGLLAGLLALIRAPDRSFRSVVHGVGASAIVGTFSILWYILMLRPIIPFAALREFWQSSYLDLGDWSHSWRLTTLLFRMGFDAPVLLAVFVLLAATVTVAITRPAHAVLFGLPVVFAIVGSFLEQAPFGSGRTDAWFYAPMVFMVVTALDVAIARVDRVQRSPQSDPRLGPGILVRVATVVTAVVLVTSFAIDGFPGGYEEYGLGIYQTQPNVEPLVHQLDERRESDDLVVVASGFTFLYPLYSSDAVTTAPTETNVAGWYPVVKGANVLFRSRYRDGDAEMRRRIDAGVRDVWLLDAPKGRFPLGPQSRLELDRAGFELVKKTRAPASVLEQWRRTP